MKNQKIADDFIVFIKDQDKRKLADIILKYASKNPDFYNYLSLNYFDKGSTEKNMFDDCRNDLEIICTGYYRAYAIQLQVRKMLQKATKKINEFTTVNKNKKLEADLLFFVLDYTFTNYSDELGTCFTPFDSKLGVMTKRLLTVLKKIHPDYLIEYSGKINFFLDILHEKSNHIDLIYALPKKLE